MIKDHMNKKSIVIASTILLALVLIVLLTGDGRIGFESGCGRFVDSKGVSYPTVQIRDRCWTAENLRTDLDSEGVEIDRYCHADDLTNCELYGGLYTWDDAARICPDGWGLPGDDEWLEMEILLGMEEAEADNIGWRESGNVGDKLKADDLCSVAGGTDCGSSGFDAVLAGYRDLEGNYFALDSFAYFWTSTESGPNAWARHFRVNDPWSYRATYDKGWALSVRCIKDR